MKFSEAQVDPVKLESGDWVDGIPEMGELRLKVRGANNSDWRKLERKLMEAVPRGKKYGGRIDHAEADRITSTCLHQCCLLDWDGLEDDDGKPIPYSKETAHEICFLPQNQRLRAAVIWACNVVAEQQSSDQEEVVKN